MRFLHVPFDCSGSASLWFAFLFNVLGVRYLFCFGSVSISVLRIFPFFMSFGCSFYPFLSLLFIASWRQLSDTSTSDVTTQRLQKRGQREHGYDDAARLTLCKYGFKLQTYST